VAILLAALLFDAWAKGSPDCYGEDLGMSIEEKAREYAHDHFFDLKTSEGKIVEAYKSGYLQAIEDALRIVDSVNEELSDEDHIEKVVCELRFLKLKEGAK
jgi:hypothetical protein